MSFIEKLNKLAKIVNDPGSYYAPEDKDIAKVTLPPPAALGPMTVTNGGTGYFTTTVAPMSPGFSYTSIGTTPPIYSRSVMYGTSVVTLYDNTGKRLVELQNDGSVVWDKEIVIDEAAEAFSKSMNLGVEYSAGITASVKSKMRDSVFNDLIEIAKEKGSLTAEDLTYLLSASKIIEKLKGKE